jgi:hypothetical protein
VYAYVLLLPKVHVVSKVHVLFGLGENWNVRVRVMWVSADV